MNYSFSVMRFRSGLAALAVPFILAGAPSAMPAASADAVAYLVNVTVRPGYNFANADQAVSYGGGVCDKIAQGRPYAQLIADIKNDFNTSDDYQASYLITQSANELCPAQIWQLRNSAAGYTGSS
jgi:hypothetical protein